MPSWLKVLPDLGSGAGVLQALGLKMSQNQFYDVSPVREAIKFIAYLTFNFLGLAIFLAGVGLWQAARTELWAVLPPVIWAAAFVYAGVNSSIPDKFNVYVIVYPGFAILAGLGAGWTVQRYQLGPRGAVAILVLILILPPIGYATAVKASERLSIDLVGARKAPQRDIAAYFLWPPKNGDFGPRIFAERALSGLPQDAILISDYTPWRPLYFVQAAESHRPDVETVFVERLLAEGVAHWISRQPCGKRVFLSTAEPRRYYQMDRSEERFTVSAFQSIYEVERSG